MERKTPRRPRDDGKVSLREWARTRRVPLSTAHKAAQAGRISRDPDGRLDPAWADREWFENTRPRVDMRCPQPPVPEGPAATEPELRRMTAEELEARYGAPAPGPNETVNLRDVLSVEAHLEDLLARELVSAMNRAIVDIAPRLARPQDGAIVSGRLYDALLDGWQGLESRGV